MLGKTHSTCGEQGAYCMNSNKNRLSRKLVRFLEGTVHLIWQGGDEDIEGGGSENFYTPERVALRKLGGGGGEGSENLYTSKQTGGMGAPKKLNR